MAKVRHISQAMIDSLRGTIDFYYWRGIPVVRTWPKKSTVPASPAMLAARAAFTASRVDVKTVGPAVRAEWVATATGEKQAWLDYFTYAYMSVWKSTGQYPPVVTDFEIIEEPAP
jgi:hypothetical protein